MSKRAKRSLNDPGTPREQATHVLLTALSEVGRLLPGNVRWRAADDVLWVEGEDGAKVLSVTFVMRDEFEREIAHLMAGAE